MKKFLVAGITVGLLLTFILPAMGVKFTFDLSKGIVSFNFTTNGVYNPVNLTITGTNGFAQTLMDTDAYKSDTLIESSGELNFSQIATVARMELEANIFGRLSSTTSTGETTTSVNFDGDGSVNVQVGTGDTGLDPSEIEIDSKVYVDADSGTVVFENSQPGPDAAQIVGQRLGISGNEADRLLREFGRHRVMGALDGLDSHNGGRGGATVAGGGGALEAGVVSVNDLSSQLVFRLFLNGTRYEGHLEDSILYVRLYHPDTTQQIKDMHTLITIVDPTPPPPIHGSNVILWDVLTYDDQQGCYLYPFDSAGLSPGIYEAYIDVGRIQNVKFLIAVTREGQVIPGGPKYEGHLKDSCVYMRLYHPVTGAPIKDIPVTITIVNPNSSSGPVAVRSAAFPYNNGKDCYLYPIDPDGLRPGQYELFINLGGIGKVRLPIGVTEEGQVLARREQPAPTLVGKK